MKTLLVLVVIAVLGALPSHAGTPFGGDDSGFVPPTKVELACGSKALLLATKTSTKIDLCHVDFAGDALAGQGIGNSEDACENAATSKLGGKLNSLFARFQCPSCLTALENTLGDSIETERDAANGDVFCAGTTLLSTESADDTGFVPPDAQTFKCEGTVAKNLAKLRACIAKCHTKLAKYAFAQRPFDDDACESTDPLRSCRAKYNRVRDKIAPICPACLDAAAQDNLANGVETDADADLGTFFCASPSAAFVD
jgi:hypothetical protein